MQRLIDHLRYGTAYLGDVTRDTLDCLERLAEAEALAEATSDNLDEALSQLPEEDFLEEPMSILRGLDGLSVSEILDAVDQALEELEVIQQQTNGASEYARSLRGDK